MLGFAPSTLLGIPGLIGLAIAVVARVAFGAYLKQNRKIRGARGVIRDAAADRSLLLPRCARELAFRLTWHQERDFDPAFRWG